MIDVEVAVDSVAGVAAARAGGAARVELGAALEVGGLTPSAGLCALACGEPLPVAVLIRPRPGDFLYDAGERATVERDVEHAKAAGAAGVALGCLTADGDVDRAWLADLVARARPLAVTFHRAFDAARDARAALEALIELGVGRVLTSGGAARAASGLDAISALVRAARGRIEVVPAGGVRAPDARRILEATRARALHLSARAPARSAMRHQNPALALAASDVAPRDAYARGATDAEAVRAVVDAVAGL